MMKIIFGLMIFLLFAFTSRVHAQEGMGLSGIFIEPMVTYENGSGDINFPSPFNNSETTVDGFGVGARFGAQVYSTVFAGFDARYSIPNFEDTTLKQNISSTAWNFAPLVGIQMPSIVDLRFWGSWILAGELDPDLDKGVDEKFKSGNGYRLGLGFRVALISLNLEYQFVKYDETEISEVGIFTPGYTTNNIVLENKSLVFSVSMPIGI